MQFSAFYVSGNFLAHEEAVPCGVFQSFAVAVVAVETVAKRVYLVVAVVVADVEHQGRERGGERIAHLVEGYGFVLEVGLHEGLHGYGLADVDHEVAIGTLVVVEVDACGDDVQRVVAQALLRLAGDAEHAFAQGEQLVAIVVAPFGHEA